MVPATPAPRNNGRDPRVLDTPLWSPMTPPKSSLKADQRAGPIVARILSLLGQLAPPKMAPLTIDLTGVVPPPPEDQQRAKQPEAQVQQPKKQTRMNTKVAKQEPKAQRSTNQNNKVSKQEPKQRSINQNNNVSKQEPKKQRSTTQNKKVTEPKTSRTNTSNPARTSRALECARSNHKTKSQQQPYKVGNCPHPDCELKTSHTHRFQCPYCYVRVVIHTHHGIDDLPFLPTAPPPRPVKAAYVRTGDYEAEFKKAFADVKLEEKKAGGLSFLRSKIRSIIDENRDKDSNFFHNGMIKPTLVLTEEYVRREPSVLFAHPENPANSRVKKPAKKEAPSLEQLLKLRQKQALAERTGYEMKEGVNIPALDGHTSLRLEAIEAQRKTEVSSQSIDLTMDLPDINNQHNPSVGEPYFEIINGRARVVNNRPPTRPYQSPYSQPALQHNSQPAPQHTAQPAPQLASQLATQHSSKLPPTKLWSPPKKSNQSRPQPRPAPINTTLQPGYSPTTIQGATAPRKRSYNTMSAPTEAERKKAFATMEATIKSVRQATSPQHIATSPPQYDLLDLHPPKKVAKTATQQRPSQPPTEQRIGVSVPPAGAQPARSYRRPQMGMTSNGQLRQPQMGMDSKGQLVDLQAPYQYHPVKYQSLPPPPPPPEDDIPPPPPPEDEAPPPNPRSSPILAKVPPWRMKGPMSIPGYPSLPPSSSYQSNSQPHHLHPFDAPKVDANGITTQAPLIAHPSLPPRPPMPKGNGLGNGNKRKAMGMGVLGGRVEKNVGPRR